MGATSVLLVDDGGVGDDYAHLVTIDPKVATKFDMLEESEFWSEYADEGESEDDDTAIDEANGTSGRG
jgi:hypothetical protein